MEKRKRCNMPNYVIRSLGLAFVTAAMLTMVSDKREFGELVARADIAQQASFASTKCPPSREHIDQADIDLLSICLTNGLKSVRSRAAVSGIRHEGVCRVRCR